MKLPRARIHWVEVCTYPAYGKIDLHSHDFFHYIYVLAGAGEIEIDGSAYPLKPKHIYLVSPGKAHTFQNSQADKMVTLEIKFAYRDLSDGEKLTQLPHVLDTSGTPILSILQNIRRESILGSHDSGDIICLNLQEICLHLLRLSGGQPTADHEGFARVIEYIGNNLDCDINLQDLANLVCLEKTWFLKKFKQLTGMTPMAYTRNARIARAKELLEFSDMNVTQIAEAVGFQSIHYFTRQFTAVEGVSPSQYKRQHQMPE